MPKVKAYDSETGLPMVVVNMRMDAELWEYLAIIRFSRTGERLVPTVRSMIIEQMDRENPRWREEAAEHLDERCPGWRTSDVI